MPWLELLKKILPLILKVLGVGGVGFASSIATQLAANPAWSGKDMAYGLIAPLATSAAAWLGSLCVPGPNHDAMLSWLASEVERGATVTPETVAKFISAVPTKTKP